jgi:hypothetical protein
MNRRIPSVMLIAQRKVDWPEIAHCQRLRGILQRVEAYHET